MPKHYAHKKVLVFIFLLAGASATFGEDQAVCNQTQQASTLDNLLETTKVVISKDLPTTRNEDTLGFKFDIEHLASGGNQYATNIDEAKKLIKENEDYSKIDFKGVLKDGLYAWASKTAYMVDVDPDYFTDELLNDPVYQEKTLVDTKVSQGATPGRLKYEKSLKFGPLTLSNASSESDSFSFNLVKNQGDIPKDQVDAIVKLDNELGGKPEKITLSFTAKSSEKSAKGGSTVNKFYRVGKDKTLVVNYCFAAIEMGKMKAAMILGITRMAVKGEAPKEGARIVELTRQYVKCHK